MRVVGAVVKREPIARALFKHELLLVRIRLTVYGEAVEFACAARDFFKQHVEALSGRGLCGRLAEDGVVPGGFGRRDPLRSTALICVFDHDAKAAFTHRIFRRTEDPDAGLFHLDPGIDALAGTEHQNIHWRWSGHGISVQRYAI